MENTDLTLLVSFIKDNKIPNIIKKPITFLGISKQPHYENVWSNIYAFFFDVNGDHAFEDLFLSSLIEVISKKVGKQFTFDSNFRVATEVTTQNNGRIDLLLCNDDEAIIIENKVFHSLINNLDDYWDSVNVSKKQGVILSLQAIDCNNIKNKKFINITHIELMNVVMNKIGKYILGANDKYLVFLKDFHQNIINVTNSMEKELIDFYFNHSEESNQIAEIRESYIKHIIYHVEDAPKYINEKFEKPQTFAKKFTYYRNTTYNDLMLTIVFEKLFTSEKILMIIVEVKNDLLDRKLELNDLVFDENENKLLNEYFQSTTKRWGHFACQIEKLTENDVLNLSTYISNTINNSAIFSIYKKLENFFEKQI